MSFEFKLDYLDWDLSFYLLISMWPWACYLTSLSFNLLICKNEAISASLKDYYGAQIKKQDVKVLKLKSSVKV